MAVRAVVGGDARVVQQRGARRVLGVAEAQQRGRRLAAGQQLVLPDGQRRGAHPPPHSSARRASRRAGEAEAERAGHVQAVAGPELAQALGARADGLEHELEAIARVAPQHAERARQERALLVAPSPPLAPRRACRTARRAAAGRRGPRRRAPRRRRARGARRPSSVRRPNGRRRARLLRGLALTPPASAGTRPAWISCSESTSAPPWRPAAIARAAASPPESVVRHGIPRAIAARRICQPSERAPEPVGVLTTRSTSPFSIQSTTLGEPSPIFLSSVAGMPMRSIASLVPRVATMRKPWSWRICAMPTAAGLSESVSVMKAVPLDGQRGAGRRLGLGERGREVARDPHDLAGGAHLGPEDRVGALEAVERAAPPP